MDSSPSVRKRLKRLHDDGTESDFTLVVGEREFKVHKMVLFLHSTVLYALVTKNEARAELKGVEADHVAAMVKFMYCQTYDQPSASLYLWQENAEFEVAMNAIGNRYNIADLRSFAQQRFKDALPSKVFRESGKPKQLAEFLDRASSNSDTTQEMRNLIIHTATDHHDVLMKLDTDPLQGVLLRKPKLAIDIIRRMAARQVATKDRDHQEADFYRHCSTRIAIDFDDLPYCERYDDYDERKALLACPDCCEKLSKQTWQAFKLISIVS
ncbi:BTB POZ domain-containing [Lecanosticta acicola]|uniref:BTB POZ domain-containing n=1 Tax=Lecanosticta acicola TaxID=111012 RepID=A0AAI8Z7Z1_9PEZI|nr:BTB POZ domain-containing [Lecanosticta acicola]